MTGSWSAWSNRLVSATTTRHRLIALSARGVGLRQVAKLTSVSRSTLVLIESDVTKRCHKSTHRAVIAAYRSGGNAAPGAHVDATRTWELVGKLLAKGWTKAGIASAMHGCPRPKLQLGRKQVKQVNASAVLRVAISAGIISARRNH